jgi:hypothetical protein
MTTEHGLLCPLHASPHVSNRQPGAGVAVSVTVDPAANALEQLAPQVIPAGELLTEPVPAREMSSWFDPPVVVSNDR